MVSLIEAGIAVSAVCLATTTALGVTNFLNGRRLRQRVQRYDEEIERLNREVQEMRRRTPGGTR